MSEQNAGSGSRKSQTTIIVVALIGFVLCACLVVAGAVAWKTLPQFRQEATPTPAPVSAVTVAPTPVKPATVIVVVTATPMPAATATPLPATKASSTPAPGATAAPTLQSPATESPAALPAGVLFYDDFASQDTSEDYGWRFSSGDSADYGWSPNQLTISVKKAEWIASVWPDGVYADFAAETEARVIEGSWAEYGLLFRIGGELSARTYYLFGITSDGYYHVWAKVNGAWSEADVVSDTRSDLIAQDKGSNSLGVIVEGNQIELYINRQLVETITDDTISEEGNIGLYAGTGDNDLARVTFRRLTVMEVDKARAEWK